MANLVKLKHEDRSIEESERATCELGGVAEVNIAVLTVHEILGGEIGTRQNKFAVADIGLQMIQRGKWRMLPHF